MTDDGPRQISDRVLEMTITGYLMPYLDDGAPILCGMPGTEDLFVLLFSSKAKLEAMMKAYNLEYESIKVVTDGREFVSGIDEENTKGRPYRIRIAVDAYKHENGRIRYTEVFALADS